MRGGVNESSSGIERVVLRSYIERADTESLVIIAKCPSLEVDQNLSSMLFNTAYSGNYAEQGGGSGQH